MIARNAPTPEPQNWQQQMQNALRSPKQLIDYLGLPENMSRDAQWGHQQFPVAVPLAYANRMNPENPQDPLLRQVLPLADEQHSLPGYSSDAVGDLEKMPVPGVIHKYHGRLLLITTAACAINCRYCFRRHFPYRQASASRQNWTAALNYLDEHKEVNEVILSGGDPLMLSNSKLQELGQQLCKIKHVKRIRIHSRLPVVLPDRVDEGLTDFLEQLPLQKLIVIHANHSAELDQQVQTALKRLSNTGVTLLNQSVLLKGINDHPETLCDLSERLFECAVMPYYLNLLDKVQGSAHFDLDLERASHIMHQMRSRISGYLVPRLVRENPGEAYKLPVL